MGTRTPRDVKGCFVWHQERTILPEFTRILQLYSHPAGFVVSSDDDQCIIHCFGISQPLSDSSIKGNRRDDDRLRIVVV